MTRTTAPRRLAPFVLAAAAGLAAALHGAEDSTVLPPPRELRFAHGSVELAGLLRVPHGAPPHPAVLLLAGSRPRTKDDALWDGTAQAFLARGFAVLTTDSRGVGGSGGTPETASFEELAGDAAAAVDALRRLPEVSGEAIGLWGASQGGTWVGPLAAERAAAAFLVAASGPLDSPEGYLHRFLAAHLRDEAGLGEADVARVTAARRAVWAYLATGDGREEAAAAIEALREEPWFGQSGLPATVRPPEELADLPASTRIFLAQRGFDPLAAIARLDCPFLAVYGAADPRLPVAEHAAALRGLASSSPSRIEVEVLAGLDHELRPAGAAGPSADEGARTDAEALMADWAARQVALAVHPARD